MILPLYPKKGLKPLANYERTAEISAISHLGFLSFIALLIAEFDQGNIPSSTSLFAIIAAMGRAPVAPGEL